MACNVANNAVERADSHGIMIGNGDVVFSILLRCQAYMAAGLTNYAISKTT